MLLVLVVDDGFFDVWPRFQNKSKADTASNRVHRTYRVSNKKTPGPRVIGVCARDEDGQRVWTDNKPGEATLEKKKMPLMTKSRNRERCGAGPGGLIVEQSKYRRVRSRELNKSHFFLESTQVSSIHCAKMMSSDNGPVCAIHPGWNAGASWGRQNSASRARRRGFGDYGA